MRALFAVLLAGCAGADPVDTDTPDTAGDPVSAGLYDATVQPVWEDHCLRCHDDRDPELDRGAERLLDAVVPCGEDGADVALVAPGDPDASYLLFKLGDDVSLVVSDDEDCQQTMPPTGLGPPRPLAAIDPDAVAAIRAWIEAGAPTE